MAVGSTGPTPFYSSRGYECARGMVGIINPGGGKDLYGYRSRAMALSLAVTPGETAYGGEMMDRADPKPARESKPQTDGGGDEALRGAAASSTRVHAAGFVAALAMAVLMA